VKEFSCCHKDKGRKKGAYFGAAGQGLGREYTILGTWGGHWAWKGSSEWGGGEEREVGNKPPVRVTNKKGQSHFSVSEMKAGRARDPLQIKETKVTWK